MYARFDKRGHPLPGSGRGCGCHICADNLAPRYERRQIPAVRDAAGEWSPLRRSLTRLFRALRAA